MPERPLIGVTLSVRRSAWIWWLHRLAIYRSGGTAIRISTRRPMDIGRLDGLVVGGGDDIAFQFEDGHLNPSIRYDPDRDQLEKALVTDAFERDLPTLGVCRGAQMINLVRGGTLYKDLSEIHESARRGRLVLPRKVIAIDKDSRLAAIMKCSPCLVNALHHQAIMKPGQGLVVVARDTLGIVQAIEAPAQRFMIGVQWHPEMLPFSGPNLNIFKALVAASR